MAADGSPRKLKTKPLTKAIRGAKGGSSGSRTPVEAPDTLNSVAHAHILDLLAEGELAGWYSDNPLKDIFLDETPVMNEDGTLNFTDVYADWREGTADQSYMKGFPSVSNEIAVGVELKQSSPWTRAVNNIQLSAVRVRLSVAALSKTNTSNGDINGHSVAYAIDLKVDGGAFVEVLQNAFTGKTNTKYERVHRIDLPPAAANWTIRVRRLTADTDSAGIQDTTFVESFTEIIDVKMRYPYSAYVGLKIDSSQFRSIPSRAFRKLGRLMRVPSNYNPVTGVYTGAWDGTFQLAWTRNPAWIFYDLITNERFGLGKYVDETQVDKWSLYQIGQYCDELVPDGKGGMEPRFTATVYLQTQQEAYKVLQDLASVFRGISYWGNGAVIPVGDMPRDPVYTYTNANVKDGKFSYQGSARRARHTVALVSWSDPTDFNRQKVEYVEDEEAVARYGVQPVQITAVGCTSQGQAQRVGRWILLTEKMETNTVTFAVGLDGQMLALPGQIIRVADAKRAGRRTGGRISVGTVNYVDVDALPVVAVGDDLICILPTGVAQKRPVSSIVGNRINVSPAFTAAPVPESIWAVESPTLKAQLYSVISVGEGEGLTAVITALQHEPGKYDAVDLGTHIDPLPTTAMVDPVQRAPTNVIISATPRAGQVIANTVVTCKWTAAAGAVSYDVQWRRSNGEWSSPQKVIGTEAELFNAFPGDYVCKVSARNALGILSVPAVSATFIVADQSLTPGFVDDLNADILAALTEAQNAAAIADGSVVSFWQDSMPVIGSGAGEAKEGDIWFDTNDGNHIWRVVGSAWVDAQDDDLAQALAAATTAQATADGKVKTWFGTVAPTAPDVTATAGIGDLWFNTTTKKLHRWNGVDWLAEIADVTLDQIGGSGVNMLRYEHSVFNGDLPDTAENAGSTAPTYDGAVSAIMGGALRTVTQGANISEGYHFGATAVDYSAPIVAGDYLVSFWAKASVAGHKVAAGLRASGGSYNKTSDVTLTTVLTRYVGQITVPADTSSFLPYIYTNRSGVAGRTVHFTGLMIEPMVGRKVIASAFTPGNPYGIAIGAIQAAAAAQDTADGKIDTFFQDAMPTGSLGDLWFDTNDGNKQYRHNGTTFVLAQDTAIGDAILAAAGAQAAADGKIRTFYQPAAPTATAVGDLWVDTDDKNKLHRWSGSAWIEIRDVGIQDALDSLTGGGNLVPNSDFDDVVGSGAASYPATGYSISNNITLPLMSYGVDAVSSYFWIPDIHVMVMRNLHGAPLAVGQYFQLNVGDASTGGPIPVEAGKEYIFSVYMAAHRAVAGFYVRFYDATGAIIPAGNANTPFVARPLGTQRLDVYERVSLKAAAPALAVRCAMWIRWQGDASYSGPDSYGACTRPMVEEAGTAQVNPSPWAPSASGILTKTLVALNNAAVAQATADGKITLFRQATAPASGMQEGDIWIDTDDDSMWVRTGAAWVLSQDNAIGDALNSAISAQATADGKAATFYSTTTPTAEGEGDLWVNPTTKVVNRWNGSAWVDALTGLASGQTSDGVLKGVSTGSNLVPNPAFGNNLVAVPVNTVLAAGDWVADNWYVQSKQPSIDIIREDDATFNGEPRIRLRNNVAIATGAGYTSAASIYSELFDVSPGKEYKIEGAFRLLRSAAPPAGFEWIVRWGIVWKDSAGATITGPYGQNTSSTGDFTIRYDQTAPGNAVKAHLWLTYYFRNTSGATINTGAQLWSDLRIMKASVVEIADLDTEVKDGTVHGRYSVDDGYFSGGYRRFGLRFHASGHRLGSQRNLMQSNTTAYGSVRNVGSLSATSAGAVSIVAHSVRYGSFSVAYSAVSNAITGLTVGTTYVIYCVDADYAGGVRTWLAGTNPDAVMQLGDGIVVAGQITIPSSGSGTGGGGAGGGDPSDWCVDYDTMLPDGRMLRDLKVGDLVECIDVTTGETGMFPLLGLGVGEEECYRLTTPELASIIQSKSTPMDLPDGRNVPTTEMFGKQVYVKLNGQSKLSIVADLERLGVRKVLKPNLGNRMFFGGEHHNATIATHNAIHKP